MNQYELDRLDEEIKEDLRVLEIFEAFKRLEHNKDFKLVFLDEYLVNEASRVVGLLADPNTQDVNTQKILNNVLIGIGYFKQYLSKVYNMGIQAERTLEAKKQTKEEILEEDD